MPLNFRLLSTTQTPNLPHFPVTLLPAIVVCSVTESHLILLWPRGEHQAPRSMGFPRQEYWSGLSFPSPRDFPDPGIKPTSPRWAGSLYHWAPRKAPPQPRTSLLYVFRDLPVLDTYLCFHGTPPSSDFSTVCVNLSTVFLHTPVVWLNLDLLSQFLPIQTYLVSPLMLLYVISPEHHCAYIRWSFYYCYYWYFTFPSAMHESTCFPTAFPTEYTVKLEFCQSGR